MDYMNIIKSFEAKELKKRPLAIRLADGLTSLFGGISFFIINLIFFTFWLLINTGKIPQVAVFDPYPFTLLTSIVSLEAIILSIIVLMSAQRQSYISTLREELNMQVNLISEKEITKILTLLRDLHLKHNKEFNDPELEEMIKRTDISYIERRLQDQIQSASKNGNVIQGVVKPIEKVTQSFEDRVLNKK